MKKGTHASFSQEYPFHKLLQAQTGLSPGFSYLEVKSHCRNASLFQSQVSLMATDPNTIKYTTRRGKQPLLPCHFYLFVMEVIARKQWLFLH